MRNNKGYTLVELLVTLAVFAIIMAEIGNMMMNSSRLYRNGTYEVELQTEAQQIVQQMEELLIDVNHSISTNYQPTLSSDYITISNNDAIYTFQLENMDAERGYGNLYYYRQSLSGGPSSNHVLMAEYVQSISLNMEAYTFDVVTLNVSMNNGKYGYQTSQDIYLRNQVGSGGGGNYNSGGSYDVDVDILRLREYNLNAYLPDGASSDMKFEWSDANPSSPDPANSYRLFQDGRIRVADAVAYGHNELGPFIVKAVSQSNPSETYTLRVSTKKLEVGSAGKAIFMTRADGSGGSFPNMTPIPVQGVAVEAAEISITLRYLKDPSGDDEVSSITMATSNMATAMPSPGEMRYNNNMDYLVQFKGSGIEFVKETTTNSFQIENIGIAGGSNPVGQYYNYIRDMNRTIFFEIKFDWGNGLEYTCRAHMYVVPSGGTAEMPEDVKTNFWNAVGF